MNYYQKKSSNHGRSSSKSSSRRRSSGGDSSGSISRRKLISVDSRVESAYYEEEDDDVHNTSRSNRLHPRTSSKNRTNNKTRKDNIAVTLPRLLDISTTSSGGTSTSSGSSSNGSSDSDNSRSDDEEQEQEELVVAAVAQRMKGTSSPNKKQQVKELVKKNRGGSKTTTSALEKNANANNAHYGGYLHNMIFKNNKKDHNKDTGPTIYSSNYGGDCEEEDEDDDINTDINASRISTTNHTRYTVESNTSTRYSSNSNDTTTTSNTSRSYYNTSKHATNHTTRSTHGSSVLSDVFEDVVAFDERKYDDRKETKKTKKSSSSSSNNNNGSSRRLQNTKNYQEESSSVSNSDDNGDLTSVSSDGDSSFDASARRQRQGRGRGRSSTKRGGQRSFITKGLLKQEQAAKMTTSSSPSKSSRASTTPRSSSRVVSPSTTNIKNTNKDVAIAAEKKNKKGKPVVVPVPTGLAIVSSLLKGATDITLDSSSILTSSNDSGTDDDAINPTDTDTDAKTDINRGMMIQTATLIADALIETSYVRTITFSGSWSSSSSETTKQDNQNNNDDNGTGTIVHDVLNKLLDGVLQNTSATTLILKDIHDFDRTIGCAFGSFLTRSSHNASNNNTNTTITKVILSNCTFQQSGFQAFVISLQHSMNTVTSLNVVDCSNFTTNDLDCISTTLVNTTILYNTYRNNTDRKINKMISSMMSPVLQSLKLSNINFHCLDMASVQYFFRAIQDATYITELDLSNNILGGTSTSGQPGLIPLLARCLAGTGTITNSKQRQQQHIERLILVDCSITRPSCLRQITNAIMMRSNDDSDDDSDEDNSADDTNTQQQQHKDKTDTANNNNDKVLPGGSSSNITYVDVSRNKFGNDGAKLLHELVVTNKSVTTLRMKHCSVGKYHMKLISDTLRINNNPFFYKLGISPDISLAILDSVNTMGNVVFGNKTNVNSSSNSVATSVTGGDGHDVDDDDDGSNAADGIFSRSPPTHRPHSYGGYYCGSGSAKKGTTTGSYGVTAAADDGDNKTTLMERFACN